MNYTALQNRPAILQSQKKFPFFSSCVTKAICIWVIQNSFKYNSVSVFLEPRPHQVNHHWSKVSSVRPAQPVLPQNSPRAEHGLDGRHHRPQRGRQGVLHLPGEPQSSAGDKAGEDGQGRLVVELQGDLLRPQPQGDARDSRPLPHRGASPAQQPVQQLDQKGTVCVLNRFPLISVIRIVSFFSDQKGIVLEYFLVGFCDNK